MSKWRIRKNQNSTGHDRFIKEIEGEYPDLMHALGAFGKGFLCKSTPDGRLWIYDNQYETMLDDINGIHALAIVEIVEPRPELDLKNEEV